MIYRQNLARVLQTVRNINVSKGRKPKMVNKPQASAGTSSTGFKFNPVTGESRPRTTSEASDGDDAMSTTSLGKLRHSFPWFIPLII